MSSLRRTPSPYVRAVAGLCVAIVLLLDVLSSSPEAHEWIHGEHGCAACAAAKPDASLAHLLRALGASPRARALIDAAHRTNTGSGHHHDPLNPNDDGCVVTLFAQGMISATVFAALIWVVFQLVCAVAQPREVIRAATPDYFLPPLCGPPEK